MYSTKDIVILLVLSVLMGTLMFAAGYIFAQDNTRRQAAQLGYGEFKVDPLKGGGSKWYWHTNSLDLSK